MSDVNEDAVLLRVAEGVGWITLNRPHAANSIDLDLATGLLDCFRAAQADSAVHAIVLESRGRFFCAGGDIAAFGTEPGQMSAKVGALARALHQATDFIASLDKPLVTAVQGTCAGAGIVLAAYGDIVLCSDQVKFHPAYAKIALTPDGGSTYFLPRLMGERRAAEMLLLSRSMTAEEALECGLVTRLHAPDALAGAVAEVAATLVAIPEQTLRRTKALLAARKDAALSEHLAAETTAIVEMAAADAAQTAIAAVQSRSGGSRS